MKNANNKKVIKGWAEVDNRGIIQKEAVGQFEIYDKKKNGLENPYRVDHSTKLVKCEIHLFATSRQKEHSAGG